MATWNFIPGLTSAKLQLLERARVPYSPFTAGDEGGILIEDTHLPTALQALGAASAHAEPSTYNGIDRLVLKFQPVNGPAAAASMQALLPVIEKVNRLQEWAALSDSERRARRKLIGLLGQTEKKLRTATGQLRTSTDKLADVEKHAAGLGNHDLPAELSSQLAAYVEALRHEQSQSRESVDKLSSEVQAAREALSANINKPRMSPEDTIKDADAALSEALQVNGSHQ